MKKPAPKRPKGKPPHLMPGLDHGLTDKIAVLTAPDFNENFRAAEVIACAYGLKHSDAVDAAVPVVSIVAKTPERLKQAFVQFQAWIDATGPDALSVEILYSKDGYYISFGPNGRHLLWRTIGLDQTVDPLLWGLTYIKTIDTRNPFLDQLAEYSRSPVGPVIVAGAEYTGPATPNRVPQPSDLRPIAGCPELFLLHLPVYKDPSEVPRESALVACTELVSKQALAATRKNANALESGPDEVCSRRDRRLSALMPVTLHMLRKFGPLRAKIETLTASGFEAWQLEQAVLNRRIWSLFSPQMRERIKTSADVLRALPDVIEVDRPNWLDVVSDDKAIIAQAQRDLRRLLKALKIPVSKSTEECQRALDRNGYLRVRAGV